MIDDADLKKLLDEFLNSGLIEKRREWFDKKMEANILPLLQKNHLPSLTVEEASTIYHTMSVGGPKLYAKSFIQNGIEKIQKSLKYLLYDSDMLEIRFFNVTENAESEFRLNGTNRAFASTALNIVKPKEYGIWNGAVDGGLKLLDLLPVREKGENQGQRYIRIIEVLKTLTKKCGFEDLFITDEFVESVLHKKIGTETKGPKFVNAITKTMGPTKDLTNSHKSPVMQNTLINIGETLADFGPDSFEIKDLYFEETAKINLTRQIKSALKNGKHIVLIGPPGTGKSKLAKEICNYYCGSKNFSMVTATSDWSTFETIGGYRPLQGGELKFFPGLFLKCFQAEGKPINKWLIIDELNRADIDKAFGSLFSALTGDDIELPFEMNGQPIKIIGNTKNVIEIKESNYIIHPHWRIIATMNTYDKSSLYEMSYAFMRRLAYIPVEIPMNINNVLIEKYVKIWRLSIEPDICNNLANLWNIVNKYRKIGPSIIEDVYKYVGDTTPRDYGSAVIMYILPQFEGLLEQQSINFVKEIIGLPFIINKGELKRFSADFFGIVEAKF